MTDAFLGVDAGNSKTVAVVADATGTVRGFGRAGVGDIYGADGEAAAVAAVTSAADAALTMAFGSPDHTRIRRASFCLAGLDWPSDDAFWTARLDERYPGLSRSLHNDGFALLRAGAPAGVGVALSAGTGGAVVARGPVGEWTASFWIREPLGGGALGHEAFDAVVRARLGIAPATSLTEIVLAHLGCADVASMLEEFTRRGGRRPVFATLARDVLVAAADGDAVARGIVETQAGHLARYAVAVADRVGLRPADRFAVVLGGSVLSSEHAALRDATTAAVEAALPGTEPRLCRVPPVLGAVGEALTESGAGMATGVWERLVSQAFPQDFFRT